MKTINPYFLKEMKGCAPMQERIAILCQSGQPASLDTVQQVVLYEKTTSGWTERKAFPFQLVPASNTGRLRDQIRDLITKLDGCRILAGSTIQGLAYHILDRMGFHIFEIQQLSPEILQDILQDIEASKIMAEQPEDIPLVPTLVSDGVYYLDFIRLQQLHPEISSKRALQPFLNTTPFVRLNILCSHIPLWLKESAYKKRYALRTKKYGDSLLLSLTIRECSK